MRFIDWDHKQDILSWLDALNLAQKASAGNGEVNRAKMIMSPLLGKI